jgi:uncharacterized membrane protein YbaN (DUF454 family)
MCFALGLGLLHLQLSARRAQNGISENWSKNRQRRTTAQVTALAVMTLTLSMSVLQLMALVLALKTTMRLVYVPLQYFINWF